MVNRTTPTTRQGGRRCPLPASLIAGLAALLGVLAPACASAADSLPSSQSVLLLYAESRVLPAVVRVDEAIRARFDAANLQAEFFTEYLDLSSASGARYAEHLRPFFLTKHRGRKFDVVVSVGTEALRFALDNRPVLFPGVPIVFCLASRAAVGDFRLPPDATGVWIVVDAAATLEAAHRLEPRARRAVVVAGAATADRILLDDVKRDLATRPAGLEVSYLAGLPLDEVREKLSRLPRETIVLFVTMFRDGAGRTFSPSQALGTIAPSSNAPVYGMSQTYLGRGIVGGRVFSLDAHGALAADLAIRILRGEPVPHIATVENPTNTYLFDWRQLNRFDLPERNVPAGSVILNRAPPLWEAYRWYIVAAVGLIGAEGLLIGALALQHRRRRRAEMAVRDRLEFETLVSDLSATFVGLLGGEIEDGIEHGLRRVGEHLRLDSALILEFTPDEQTMRLTHAWAAENVRLPRSNLDLAQFPWSMEKVRCGEVVRFSTLDELPAAAAVDRETFGRMGVQSALGIPLAGAGTAIGALSLNSVRREQEWSEDLVRRLEFVAGIFSSALLRQRVETEVRELRRDLTHVGRVATMGELTASIAHELNQPLTAILTNAQVAERLIDSGADAKAVRDIVADIVADDQRAGEVIRRVRAFVKKDETNQSRLDINAVVQDVIGLVRNDAIIRGVSIDLDLAFDLPSMVADRVQLQQVVLNLIMNGLDAMRAAADRRLAITTRVGAEGTVRVSVRDHGCGIVEDDLARIFEPFYTTKPQGLGMGLSIARSLVEAHGGRLWAESNPNGGATFTFTLPLLHRSAA